MPKAADSPGETVRKVGDGKREGREEEKKKIENEVKRKEEKGKQER